MALSTWIELGAAVSSIVRVVIWYLDRKNARARGEKPADMPPPT